MYNTLTEKKKVSLFKLPLSIIFLSLYFGFAPLENILSSSIGTIPKYIGILAIILIIIDIFFGYFRFKITYIDASLFILIIIFWVSTLWSIHPATTINRNLTYTLLPIFYIVITKIPYKQHIRLVEIAIVFTGILISLYLIYQSLMNLNVSDRATIATDNDPNNLAAYLILPVWLIIDMIFFTKKFKKIISLIFGIILIVGILLTGSRGAFISLFLSSSIFITRWFLTNKNKPQFFTVLLSLIVMLVVFLIVLPESLTKRLFSIESYIMDSTSYSSSRTNIWRVALINLMPSMSFVGYGTGTAGLLFVNYFNVITGTHNTYINIILELGLLSMPFFLIVVQLLFKKYERFTYFALLIAILIAIFFIDSFPKKYLWNALIVCSLRFKDKKMSSLSLLTS